jgi:DNA polymerase I
MSERSKLVLVDGSSYLYRAFHALPPLSTAAGEPTGAVLGVLNMLLKLLREEKPQFIAVVFDAPGRTFRDQLFEEYKAQRTPMPDDLRSQVQPLLDCVQALGLPLLRIPGVEADDVIATLARQASQAGLDVVISTIDKDMAQLVDERISIVNTMSDSRLDRAGVKLKFDVFPEQIIDYLALVGDTSDNIPGVPKVGPKTAAKWLAEYGTLDALMSNAAAITGKVGESLRASLSSLELSRRLATLDCNVPLEHTPQALLAGEPDRARQRQLYVRWELASLLRGLGESGSEPAAASVLEAEMTFEPAPVRSYETIATLEALQHWVERLQRAELASLQVQPRVIDYMRAELVGIALADAPGQAAYVPFGHTAPGAPPQLTRAQVLATLRPWLESDQPKLGHDLKYDAHVLRQHGITLRGLRCDSMLESYVLNSTGSRHELDVLARKYLGRTLIDAETLVGKGARQIAFGQVAIQGAADYTCEAADTILQLHQRLWQKLADQPALRTLYETLEQPLVEVLLRVEANGVLIDGLRLQQQSHELAARMREVEADAHRFAGQAFSLDSPKQLQEILFGKLGLPVTEKTASGQPSTAESVLEDLADKGHDLPRLILEYRALAKLKSTYADKLPAQINPATGRVHTNYRQAIAATGRLSSADPNLQNIPIRSAEGRRIRQAFVAAPGHCIVAADYSQIELRIMAHLSGDAGLLGAFAEDRDIHQATAAEVFGTPLPEVSANQRRAAKAINFGLIYGMSAFGLARQLGIERREAQKYVDLYFQRYPGVRRYMDLTRQQARELGYVETVFGRRLYLNDIHARNAALRQGAERAAINAPMQGTAADIIKRAMIEVDGWLLRTQSPARLIMQVHDELVFEVPRERSKELIEQVVVLMARAAELSIPLKVDAGVGENWDEAH